MLVEVTDQETRLPYSLGSSRRWKMGPEWAPGRGSPEGNHQDRRSIQPQSRRSSFS
ncbi:hypothetical protein LEMLEM_LOCUS12235 [Lemmus lemmus]